MGIFVAGVLEDSPAAKEGLEEGDQILRVRDTHTHTLTHADGLFLLQSTSTEAV